MLKSIPFFQFAQLLFDTKDLARKATVILKAILEAQSPRLSEIAQKMPGKPAANWKHIQRFLATTDPRLILLRLFQVDAPFVLGDYRNAASACVADLLCGNAEGWQDERLLALGVGDPFFADVPCRFTLQRIRPRPLGMKFAQLETSPCTRRHQGADR